MKKKLHNLTAWLKLLKKRRAQVLILLVILASSSMIIMNYYTIRLLSAARAYINGESQYSKGQKDASAHLISYIYLEKGADYKAFEECISIPVGDQTAREALLSNKNILEARNGFLRGKNHPDDIEDMIWFFNNFQHYGIFEKAIAIWAVGDGLVNNLQQTGLQARRKILSGNITDDEKKSLIIAIGNISGKLTIKEKAFSETLGLICRTINGWVFALNVFITVVIIGCSLLYAGIMVRNLVNSRKRVIEQNINLQAINNGLDKFVFSVTHDLRSPLASLLGLIDLVAEEPDPVQVKEYTVLMKESLEKQDKFINEMLTFVKSKHFGVVKKECSLATIIENVIATNNYSGSGKAVSFYKEIDLNKIESDALKIMIILNNLVSNAIKYSDPKKEDQWVKLKTYLLGTSAIIEVEDNGLGISQNNQEVVFDKFFKAGNHSKSTGIGLYLVKDAVTQLNGKIEIKSEPGLFTKFIIGIPC